MSHRFGSTGFSVVPMFSIDIGPRIPFPNRSNLKIVDGEMLVEWPAL